MPAVLLAAALAISAAPFQPAERECAAPPIQNAGPIPPRGDAWTSLDGSPVWVVRRARLRAAVRNGRHLLGAAWSRAFDRALRVRLEWANFLNPRPERVEVRDEPVQPIDQPTVADLPWKYQIRIAPFVFSSDREISRDQPLLVEMAELRDQVQKELLLPPSNAEVQVYLFESKERYESYLKEHHPGLPLRRAFFLAIPRGLGEGGGEDFRVYTFWSDHTRRDLRHELTHGLLHSATRTIPQWLDEGLAEYFENPPENLGVNPSHVQLLSKSLGNGSYKLSLSRLEGLEKVEDMGPAEYREAWAWVHLMLRSRPEAKTVLLTYLQKLGGKQPPGQLAPKLERVCEALDDALIEHLASLEKTAEQAAQSQTDGRFDVERLRDLIRREHRLARVEVVPVDNRSVVLKGYVQRAEDISVAGAIATSSGFAVINGLRLDAVQQVQLDVVLTEVPGDAWVSLDGCHARYASRGRRATMLAAAGKACDPLGDVVPAWAKACARALWFRCGRMASQEHLDGVLDVGQDTAFVAFLESLEAKERAKILSQPKLVTLSGQPASLLVGDEKAVPVPAGLGSVGVQFEEFGTRLNFVPVILENGNIRLEVATETTAVSERMERSADRTEQTVELEPGQSLVLGGRGRIVVVKPALVVP